MDEKNNSSLEALINTAGITAEVVRIFRDSFLESGFDEEETTYLCGILLE